MNYKKLIKSRDIRVKILSLLNWIPDRIMVPLQYRIHTGRKLNLKKSKRFTEKIQLYKLNYRNPEMLRCTDKFTVREFVKEKGLEDILIPLIGVYSSPEEIVFDSLPQQFVAKTTDGGGGNQIFICKNKSDLDKEDFFKTLKYWMDQPKSKKMSGREWAYENDLPRKILIEKLLTCSHESDLPDYKFFCFNGQPQLIQVDFDRFADTGHKKNLYNIDWEIQDFEFNYPSDRSRLKERPDNLNEMLDVAKKLAEDFPFARIDLYDTDGNVWFGEITFYPASGYGVFTPDIWDEQLGSYFNIDSFAGNKQS